MLKRITDFLTKIGFKKPIVYNYKKLKTFNKEMDFILPDIIAYNNNLELILKDNDFLKDVDYKHIIKISAETISKKELYYWCSNNDKKLEDVNKEIHLFLNLSETFIKNFYLLKKIKQNDNLYKFNIRLLQPYIINLESIREVLKNELS